ncbi:hypothetical protein WJX73_001004 [Symbiochloris irregularis]|uniref:Uncharacterized protein n=1 Tax=Symbiochloris irregularis TaxID=706552 RepID=A0AAW1NN06_9CHLO
MTLVQVKALVGEELSNAAKNGPKQFEAKASNAQCDDVFGGFYKGLRYGGCLELCDGLKFTYDKASKELKISGMYSMSK